MAGTPYTGKQGEVMLAMEAYGPVEQARAWIRGAYEEQPSTPGSVMEIFSGKGKDQGQTVGGSKRAGFSPTRIHATETSSAKGSRVPISSGTCGGNVKRAVSRLPGIYQNWIHWCYNPGHREKEQKGGPYHRRLWERYLEEHDQKGLHKNTKAVIQLMLGYQVAEASSYAGYCRWSGKCPAQFVGVIRKEWVRTYQPHWGNIRRLMVEIDGEALLKVYKGV